VESLHIDYTKKGGELFQGIPFVKMNVPSRHALLVSTHVVVPFTPLIQGIFSLLAFLRCLSLMSD